MRVCVHVLLCVSRAEGVMRTMNTDKLIKTLPTIQNQLDALLDFQVNTRPEEDAGRRGDVSTRFSLFFCLHLLSRTLTS